MTVRSRLFIALIFLLFLVFIIVSIWERPNPDHPYFNNFLDYPLVIAHADDQGNGLWPGNTMPFLEGSADLKVDVLEMDIHMTKDNSIILMHDDSVDRTTNGSGAISDMTLSEIRDLEVGGNWTQDEGLTYPYQGQGLAVPTLEEVFLKFPDYPMNIEIKQAVPSPVKPLCSLIREYNKSDQVLIASFSDEAMREFRQECPEVATSGSSSEVRNFVLTNFIALSNLLTLNYQAFQVPEESSGIPVVRPSFVKAADTRNVQVHIWTINDPDAMQRFIDMGVHGIMTDRPDILLELLER